MNTSLLRATLTPNIVEMIEQEYDISEPEALERYYKSTTAANFADDETGLYGQSALYVFSLYVQEQQEKAETSN